MFSVCSFVVKIPNMFFVFCTWSLHLYNAVDLLAPCINPISKGSLSGAIAVSAFGVPCSRKQGQFVTPLVFDWLLPQWRAKLVNTEPLVGGVVTTFVTRQLSGGEKVSNVYRGYTSLLFMFGPSANKHESSTVVPRRETKQLPTQLRCFVTVWTRTVNTKKKDP